MGASPSMTVSAYAEGEIPGPFAIRRHPDFTKGVYENPPEYPTMKEVCLEYFRDYADKPYLGTRALIGPNKYAPDYTFTTYAQGKETADQLGAGLKRIGIDVGVTIGMYSENSPQWLNCIDGSCLYGFVIVSLYDSLGPDALGYLLGHSEMKAVVVSKRHYESLMKILNQDSYKVHHVIVIGDSIPEGPVPEKVTVVTFNDLLADGKEHPIDYPTFDPETPLFICYSSGTTGNPKGVIISHRANVSNMLAAQAMIDVGKDGRHLSYLPLAHVFERAAVSITCRGGGRIGFISGGVTTLLADMAALKPTYFPAVPRVMNRFYTGVMNKIGDSKVKKAVFWGAWYAKRFCINHGLPTGILDAAVFNQVKKMMGGSVDQFVVGGAAMDPMIQEFLQVATGIPVRTGYGLTEAGSGNICNPKPLVHCIKGTVGGPLQNVSVYLEPIDDYDKPNCGQIIIGGPCLSSGYLHDEEATSNLFTDETHQWIRTGDVGCWDENGYLMIVDRMRSIFKLSQGEYVAADLLMQIYEQCDFVKQIFIYGDSQRSYLVAVIVPEKSAIAKELGLGRMTDEEYRDACKNPKINEAILKQLRAKSDEQKLFGYQRILKVYVEPEEWTIDNEYMTPTYKLKRKKLETRYHDIIEGLYKE